MDYVLLIVGLTLLLKGADWLVRGASSVARSLKISDMVVGLTVVSFGTSLPELVIGLVAGSQGNSDLFIGNVIGSNVANILLILGVAAMICPLVAKRGTVWKEMPFTLGAVVLFYLLLNDELLRGSATSQLSRLDGLVLLGFFGFFIFYVMKMIKGDKEQEWLEDLPTDTRLRSTVEILVGIAGLVIGGKLAVDSAQSIALAMGFSQAFIGLTVIAIGTSLPELATSGVAAYRKNVDIAVGNVVGSNIFNIFIVAGLSSLVQPMAYNPVNNSDIFVMALATLILFVSMFIGKVRYSINRIEGAIMVVFYVAYLAYLVNRG